MPEADISSTSKSTGSTSTRRGGYSRCRLGFLAAWTAQIVGTDQAGRQNRDAQGANSTKTHDTLPDAGDFVY